MAKRKFTIEQARILKGLTQEQAAAALGISTKTYIQYEKYRRIFNMRLGFLFARLVEMDFDEIIFFDPELQKECS